VNVTGPGDPAAAKVIAGGPAAAPLAVKLWHWAQAWPGLCWALSAWHVRQVSRGAGAQACGAWHVVQPAPAWIAALCRPARSVWQVVQLDPQSAPGHRLFGLALAAVGRFREAAQVWDQWRRLVDKPPEEDAQSPAVERVRQAALTIDLALRGARD